METEVEGTKETIEEVFAEEVEETGQLTIQKELEAKLEEADTRYLRLQADFDNFRRRTKLDFEANQKYRAQNIISDILPVLDNFERALQTPVDNEQAKSLLQGMEMVYRSLLEALNKEGVEAVDAVGKEFDPHLHQAVMQVEAENTNSGIVLEEFQKGYKLKDRVIRPAMVKVSQ
ncbi:nucleotide exchange factor GrpE [Bacillus sp. CGMCC 1.16607]|uniref:nucleotide exchange factor GrpE n=1 Tax=Bacillus sp. CGMCC 1.16607 TaxID=3351842 RepID=UPI00363CBBB7